MNSPPYPFADSVASPSAELKSGHGRIVVSSHASKAVFSELAATYPLKLLSPRVGADGVAVAYVLSYGGGLIGGDEVVLDVKVKDDARLVLLSQGSTKVFKMRLGTRLASSAWVDSSLASPQPIPEGSADAPTLTTQVMDYRVHEGCGLYLLPEPVTCFRDASYKQIQRFHLEDRTSSLVLVDSITSGRQALGEDWDFAKYYSMNEVWIGGKLITKDVMLLEGDREAAKSPDDSSRHRVPKRLLRDQLAPYSCYAMVLLYGPQAQETIEDIANQYKEHIVYQRRMPTDSLWSFSLLGENTTDGAVVRIAGKETEVVRSCLKATLRRLERVIGVDTFRRAFA
ncbi:UreD urease accessory protein-domain-containing protein [Ephemerocybe angulata]|uniref:UreD urease accessory protein-domain-containing protein n=1 Tax=Ephemerocybe angulata TaxID=980116 RepID=A0A8H6MEK4_9AGAR|nr:UreD urease accessory protein-domain-containing protein [Tulosesus angulatus]